MIERTPEWPRCRWAAMAAGCVVLLAGGVLGGAVRPVSPRAAFAIVNLADGVTIAEARPDILDTPVQPGSLMKLVTAAAAIDSGTITRDTRIACARRVRHGSRVLDCSHPDLGRPLSTIEAIAHSCNSFFGEVGRRLSVSQLSAAAVRFGLPPMRARDDPTLLALGLGSYRVPTRAWIPAMSKLVSGQGIDQNTRAVVLDGLRLAFESGTASGTELAGSALAKTGTAAMPGGGIEGLAVLLTPAASPRYIVVAVAPGAAGRDALQVAAAALASHARGDARDPARAASTRGRLESTLRVGSPGAGEMQVREWGLEEYVSAVLAGEAPPRAPAAALEALAIAIRTFALANRARHAADGFDLCDLTHCQVLRPSTAATRRAAEATAGLVLTWQGTYAPVHYSASCGGHSELPINVWPGDGQPGPPFLVAQPDPAGAQAQEARWTTELGADEVMDVLRAAGLRGTRLEAFDVVDRTASGRARTLRIRGFVPDSLPAERFRVAAGRTLGWQHVKSTWFEIERTARGYQLVGRGHGHGVGLCVRGAIALAGAGRAAPDILRAYLPGTGLAPLDASAASPARGARTETGAGPAPKTGTVGGELQATLAVSTVAPRIQLVLPREHEHWRVRLLAQLRDALTRVSARLGAGAPPEVTVRFHPTVGSYRRATRRPWWTAARTAGAEIDFAPVDVLLRQNQLARSIHHEVVHVITGSTLRDRPLWAAEGLAEHVAGAPGGRAVERDERCPLDDEFRRAASARELRALYSRAETCVARALAHGVTWRNLGAN